MADKILTNPFEEIHLRFNKLESLLLTLHSMVVEKSDLHEQEERLINIEEAAKLINRTVGTIHVLTSKNLLPHTKKGRKLMFSKAELNAWLMDGKNVTLSQIQKNSERA